MNNKLEKIMKIVDSNDLMNMVNEVNAWDNSLDYLNFIDMEDFDEYMNHLPAIDLAYKIHYGDFNPCDDYFNFNAYGNLISYDEYDMKHELNDCKEDIVERFIELYEEGHLDIYNEEIETILDNEEIKA